MVKKYYIIGGGVSGLATAYELAKKGCNVCLLEKDTCLGGLAKTISWNGVPIDMGPHIYHTSNTEISDYWKENFKGLFFERDHWSRNFKDGIYYDYPLSYESIDNMPSLVKDKIKNELNSKNKAKRKSANNYYEYIQALVGTTLQELFFIRYPEKLWGMPVKELDANWAPKRLEIRKNKTPFYYGQWCAVGVAGSGSIIDKLHKNLTAFGCEIFLGEEVKELCISNDKIQKIITNHKNIDVGASDIVINTSSCTMISRLLGNHTNLRYRGVIIVYIYAKRNSPFPKGVDFVYFDDPNILFHRVSLQSQFVKKFPKDKEVYVCEIAYSAGDATDRKRKKELANEIMRQFESLGFTKREDAIDLKVIKIPEAYPSFFVGYREVLAKTIADIDTISNLYNIGSLAEYDYSDLQILFSKAIDMANVLTSKTFKVNNMNKNIAKISFKKTVDIKGKIVGEGHPTFIIAEVGLNHNGDIGLAKKLIDESVRSGADAVKFQSYDAKNRIAEYGRTSRYADKTLQAEETDYDMLKKCELSRVNMKKLFEYAKSRIEIFSTPFDLKSVDGLENLGVRLYKISSFDVTNISLIEKIALTHKPVIMSTGMANLSEIESALQAMASAGNDKVVLLHCVSSYPCTPDNMNLRAMDTIRAAFGVPVGLSDHVIGDMISLVAVARGANVIEKHFTLDKNMEGPDHALSLNPSEFKNMVDKIRLVEKSLGDGIKQPLANEFTTMLRFRKTMYAGRDIKKNKVIARQDITLKGPAYGIYPKYMDIVIGQKAAKDIKKDTPLTWEIIGNG